MKSNMFRLTFTLSLLASFAMGQVPRPQPLSYQPSPTATTISVKWFAYAVYLESEIARLNAGQAPAPSGGSLADVVNRLDTIDKNTAALAGNFYSIKANVDSTLTLAKSTDAKLAGLGAPTSISITIPPPDSVSVGQSITFIGSATADLPPTWQWFKNGTPIPDATQAKLILPSLQLSDAGVYKLKASNGAGSAEASTTLNIVP